MAMNYELERHIRAAQDALNQGEAVRDLLAMKTVFNSLVNAGVVKELPLETRPLEVQPAAQTALEAQPIETLRFSQEAREALTQKGFVIYELTGQSIKSQRDAGRKFWSTWHKDYPQFEALPSRHAEVAVNPKALFIPKSNDKTLSEQEAMVAKFSQELGKKVPGAEVVIGEAADYVELAFAHLDATTEQGNPVRLFGETYGYNYTRTKTPTVGSLLAVVGDFRADDGPSVYGYRPGDRGGDVRVSPLVVPAGK